MYSLTFIPSVPSFNLFPLRISLGDVMHPCFLRCTNFNPPQHLDPKSPRHFPAVEFLGTFPQIFSSCRAFGHFLKFRAGENAESARNAIYVIFSQGLCSARSSATALHEFPQVCFASTKPAFQSLKLCLWNMIGKISQKPGRHKCHQNTAPDELLA